MSRVLELRGNPAAAAAVPDGKIVPEPSKRVKPKLRPVLVVSSTKHNACFPPVVAAITSSAAHARDHGMSVSPSGTGCRTRGVVLAIGSGSSTSRRAAPDQQKSAPDFVVDDVAARVAAILEVG